MVHRTLMAIPLLTTTVFVPLRCEAEGVDANPYTGHIHADRIAILVPAQEQHCVHGIVGHFQLDGVGYAIIDFECDSTIDAIEREDGLLLLVVPNRGERVASDFDPVADIDWNAVIDDGTPSPFVEEHAGEWLQRHALHELTHDVVFPQRLAVNDWSVDDWTGDVTLATSSMLQCIDPQEYGLNYQWFTAHDVRQDIRCSSIRVQGDLSNVIRWLIANGVRELRTLFHPIECACTWNPEHRIVECRRAGVLVFTIDPNR